MIRTIAIAIAILLLPVLGAVEESGPKIFTIHEGLEKASQPLPTVPAETILRDVGGDRFESASDGTGQSWLRMPRDSHPVVQAAHLAFAGHRPFALSPDIVWLLMTQMVAREVVADPERFRGILVSHQAGQKVLSVSRDQFVLGAATNDWPGVFAEFEEQIVARSHDGVVSIFSHAFSSSQAAEVATRRVTLMKTVSPFYRYEVFTECGIPEIHLYGTPQDWSWIRTHMDQFGKLGLAQRMHALEPVIDQCVLAAEGKGNPYFWRNFYKYEEMSGNETTSGWINLFFLKHEDDVVPFEWGRKDNASDPLGLGAEDGLPYNLQEVPPAWVAQEFIWSYLGNRLSMMLRAGFLGIEQDPLTLALRPRLGWQVFGVQDTPEQRSLRLFLADQRTLWMVLNRVTCDEASHTVRLATKGATPNLPREALLKVLSMMTNLEDVDIRELLPRQPGDPVFQKFADAEVCRALLALPSIKRVVATPALCTPECWDMLRQRQDWKLAAPGEP